MVAPITKEQLALFAKKHSAKDIISYVSLQRPITME